MKRTLSELRLVIKETIKELLREAVCPFCGDPDAYVGLSDVECPNKRCRKFSQKQKDIVGRHPAPATVDDLIWGLEMYPLSFPFHSSPSRKKIVDALQ